MPDYPPIDYLRGMPPIEERTDEEWEDYARFVIAESNVLDGDVEAMALALKSSAERERQLRNGYLQGWADIEDEAFTEHADRIRRSISESGVAEVIRVDDLAAELHVEALELLAKLAEYGSTVARTDVHVDHDTAQIMRGIYAEGE
ncbi:hypothetical protein LQL77_07160 [Rhodococcus cerastii]|nr:hypothetical protein [Rhodococcus cerastii]